MDLSIQDLALTLCVLALWKQKLHSENNKASNGTKIIIDGLEPIIIISLN